MANVRILVVEDETLIATRINARLKQLGYETLDVITSGEEAVRQAVALSPDLILMDIQLQGELDGITASAQIREQLDVPIIYLTASSNDEVLRRAKLTEPLGYLIKPFEGSELRAAVEIALFKHKMDRQLRESEARYRRLLESVTDYTYTVILHDGRPVHTIHGPGCVAVTGYTPEEYAADPYLWYRMVHEADRAVVDKMNAAILAGEAVSYWEHRIIHKNGSVRWIRNTPVLRYDETGRLVAYDGSITDITARKQAEEALRQERDRAQLYLDTVGVLVVALDRTGVVTLINKKGCEILGYCEAEIVGKNWFDHFLPPRDRERVKSVFQQLMRGERAPVEYYENPVLASGEEERLIAWHNALLHDHQGRISGTLSSGEDITERRKAEEERDRLTLQLREQARRIQQVINTVPEGVILLDPDGRILLANPVGEQDLITLAGVKVGDILTHLGNHALAELLTSPPKGLWHEVAIGGVDGYPERVFEVIARPMKNGRQPEDWVMVINEVTREREIRRYAQQQDRLAAVGQLAAGIAHDFNNVLAVIALYARMSLREPDISPRLRERMEIIDQQAWRASGLIQQILDFSRRAVIERRPLDLVTLLKEQIGLLEHVLPENIQIRLSHERSEHIVNGDPTRLQQAIMNMATNARDAMPDGGELTFSLDSIYVEDDKHAPLPGMGPGEWVRLMVADNGVGIPPEVRPHLFDPFFTTKGPDKGTGLGLAQVFGIVKAHDGYIDVATEVGEGTTFSIYLPAMALRPPETRPHVAASLPQGHGQLILVVEDEAAMREALAESLQSLNYRVITASNGQEALAVLDQRADEISLVLSDLVMPVMGGQALFYTLKARYPTVKIVLLTGHPLQDDLEILQTEGLAGWLLKPPDMKQLAEVVQRALGEV